MACTWPGISLLSRTVPTCGVIHFPVTHRYLVMLSALT
jgi:hypothetical protein